LAPASWRRWLAGVPAAMEIARDGVRDGRVASDAREKSCGGALAQRRRADDGKKER
jgi:hypothetical protein